jgi:hypothetical protein
MNFFMCLESLGQFVVKSDVRILGITLVLVLYFEMYSVFTKPTLPQAIT